MCRILAYSTNYDQGIKETIHQLPILAKNGNVPVGFRKGHSEGWGMVGYRERKHVFRHRSELPIYRDDSFFTHSQELLKSLPDIVIGHARKATIGKVAVTNNHPFVYKNFSFCHNGSFFQSQSIPLTQEFKKKIEGTTDTEHLFYYIIQLLENKENPSSSQVRTALKNAIRYLRKHHEYTALNVVLSDGRYMWALREVSETDRLVKLLKLPAYFTLYYGHSKKMNNFVVSSEQMPIPSIKWNLMKNHELVEYDTASRKIKSYSFK